MGWVMVCLQTYTTRTRLQIGRAQPSREEGREFESIHYQIVSTQDSRQRPVRASRVPVCQVGTSCVDTRVVWVPACQIGTSCVDTWLSGASVSDKGQLCTHMGWDLLIVEARFVISWLEKGKEETAASIVSEPGGLSTALPAGVTMVSVGVFCPHNVYHLSRRALTCGNTHSWRRYSVAPLGDQGTCTVIPYPSQSDFPQFKLSRPCPILVCTNNAKRQARFGQVSIL